MGKKQWSAQKLKQILGEPHSLGPRSQTASGPVNVSRIRLKPGEQPGWMCWNCAGGNPVEQIRKAYLEVRAANSSRPLTSDEAAHLEANYLGCAAGVSSDDPTLWVMIRVCHKHYPAFCEGSN